jgi:hypothetical protein
MSAHGHPMTIRTIVGERGRFDMAFGPARLAYLAAREAAR